MPMSGINCGLVKEIERKKTPKDKREKFTLQARLILKKKKRQAFNIIQKTVSGIKEMIANMFTGLARQKLALKFILNWILRLVDYAKEFN